MLIAERQSQKEIEAVFGNAVGVLHLPIYH